MDFCENSTMLLGMPTHLDRCPSLLCTLSLSLSLSCRPVTTAVQCQLATRVTLRQLHSLSSFVQLVFTSYFRSRRDLESKPFVWFRAKTDKGIVCLADHQQMFLKSYLHFSSYIQFSLNYINIWKILFEFLQILFNGL